MAKYKKGSFITVPNQTSIFGIDPKAQCLYMWLCFHSNQDGECFPSRKLLSEESGMSIASVKRSLKTLTDRKILSVKNRKNGKENITNLYSINIQ